MNRFYLLTISAFVISLGFLACDLFQPNGGDPEITITFASNEPGNRRVEGTTRNADPATMKVVLWAKTDRWYVQPLIASPFTSIRNDGTWQNWTHPWAQIVALLVDTSYVPGATRQHHPATDPGVLSWDEKPERSLDRHVEFSGYSWRVKRAEAFKSGPGPNYFSDSNQNVWVDSEGLHLRITSRDGKWFCAEVVLQESLGYGTYTFQLGSPVNALDFRAVFAGFVYESETREIDIEFSQVLARPHNAQYVVQPYTLPGNLVRFTMPQVNTSSHRFVWRPDSIVFGSWSGLEPEPQPSNLLHSWTYEGPDIPPPGGERMRFNLWLFDGSAPQSGRGDEVLVKSFKYSGNQP